MTNHPNYPRPRWYVPWDRNMRAQMSSGRGKIWTVTRDSDRFGRILNIRERRCVFWMVTKDGKNIYLRGMEPVVPKHCIETVKQLLRRPNEDDLLQAARAEISCLTTLIYDLAAENGQQVDNVKHMSWFTRIVEDRLIAELDRFSHLAPSYKEQT